MANRVYGFWCQVCRTSSVMGERTRRVEVEPGVFAHSKCAKRYSARMLPLLPKIVTVQETKGPPVPVTLDLIKDLRRQRRFREANEMVTLFRKNNLQEKRQEFREIRRDDRLKKISLGFCGVLGCTRPVVDGLKSCEPCRLGNLASHKRHQQTVNNPHR